MIKQKKLLILSCALLAKNVSAQIQSDLTDSILTNTVYLSGACYNHTDLVQIKSNAKRTQNDQNLREQLAKVKEVISFSSTSLNGKDSPAGLVTYERTEKGQHRISVGYHGTECSADLWTDIAAVKKSNSVIGLTGYSHGGFMNRYLEGRDSLHAILQHIMDDKGLNNCDIQINVTGHSMGGALATLAAVDIQKNLFADAQVNLVTYSSPRVLDHTAVTECEALLKGHAQRIWRKGDPISCTSLGTNLLFGWGWLTGFKHFGTSTPLMSETTGYLASMANHAHTLHIRDITSPEMIKPVAHQGWKSWAKSWAAWPLDVLKSAYRKLTK